MKIPSVDYCSTPLLEVPVRELFRTQSLAWIDGCRFGRRSGMCPSRTTAQQHNNSPRQSVSLLWGRDRWKAQFSVLFPRMHSRQVPKSLISAILQHIVQVAEFLHSFWIWSCRFCVQPPEPNLELSQGFVFDSALEHTTWSTPAGWGMWVVASLSSLLILQGKGVFMLRLLDFVSSLNLCFHRSPCRRWLHPSPREGNNRLIWYADSDAGMFEAKSFTSWWAGRLTFSHTSLAGARDLRCVKGQARAQFAVALWDGANTENLVSGK